MIDLHRLIPPPGSAAPIEIMPTELPAMVEEAGPAASRSANARGVEGAARFGIAAVRAEPSIDLRAPKSPETEAVDARR
jgi:hypothetical protein